MMHVSVYGEPHVWTSNPSLTRPQLIALRWPWATRKVGPWAIVAFVGALVAFAIGCSFAASRLDDDMSGLATALIIGAFTLSICVLEGVAIVHNMAKEEMARMRRDPSFRFAPMQFDTIGYLVVRLYNDAIWKDNYPLSADESAAIGQWLTDCWERDRKYLEEPPANDGKAGAELRHLQELTDRIGSFKRLPLTFPADFERSTLGVISNAQLKLRDEVVDMIHMKSWTIQKIADDVVDLHSLLQRLEAQTRTT